MIVVTGATGKLGHLVIDALLKRVPASQIAAAVRTPANAADLAALGVEVRRADYDRPETLASAFKAGEQVLLISANEVGSRARQHTAVVDAATRAGVASIAYTSVLNADRSTLSLAAEHRATEEAIRASGLPFVFLRNGWYLENHTDQLGGILQRGMLAGSATAGRFASAARRDYAEAAAAVLTAPGPRQAIYELAGEPFTLAEFAAEAARQTGTAIEYRDLTPEAYKSVLLGTGLPPAVADLLVNFDMAAARGDLEHPSDELRRLIGRPPTSLREAIAEGLRAGAPAR